MQHSEVPVQRLTNGVIDYDFYRAEAARMRKRAIWRFWREIGFRSAGWLRAQTARISGLGRHVGARPRASIRP
jgi:hypothetical protein